MDDHQIHTFPSGLRLFHQQFSSRITHCGFVMDAGSRDEEPAEMGMAHFIEHLFFKGTEKRTSLQVLNRLEVVGGELNAYTTKDKTCVYASVNSDYSSRTLELLCDIVFHSVFPEKEIEKERNVIHEEIDMYLDSPEENILDLFQEKAFPKHPLGFNILGTHDSLNTFNRERILSFYHSWYTPDKMVFVYSGPKSFRQVIRMLEKWTPDPSAKKSKSRLGFTGKAYRPFREELSMPHVQSYLSIGGLAPDNHDEKRAAMALLTNIIGGPGLNSRLNLAIREKHGFAYDVEANYQGMRDLGLFNIYVGTDKKHLSKCVSIIYKELARWRDRTISSSQLQQYKNQLKGQILMGEENRAGLVLSAGKMLLDDRSIDTLETVFARVDAIQRNDLQEAAQRYLKEEDLSHLVFKGQIND